MIKEKDLIERNIHKIEGFHREVWYIDIGNIRVSVVRFDKAYYNGAFEIFSDNELFDDVERYMTLKEVLKRLNELVKEKDES